MPDRDCDDGPALSRRAALERTFGAGAALGAVGVTGSGSALAQQNESGGNQSGGNQTDGGNGDESGASGGVPTILQLVGAAFVVAFLSPLLFLLFLYNRGGAGGEREFGP